MYISTYPQAENAYMSSLSVQGEKSWDWVELSINVRLFVASADFTEDGLTFGRTFIFGNMRQLIEFCEQQDPNRSNIKVSLLSPNHMNGTPTYQLGALAEIWSDPQSGSELFEFRDGATMKNTEDGNRLIKERMKKVLSF